MFTRRRCWLWQTVVLLLACLPCLTAEPITVPRRSCAPIDYGMDREKAANVAGESIVGETPRTITEFTKITPSDGYPVAFGASVAVSGDNLVVGAPGYITEDGMVGTAYVFHRVGPKWIEIGKLFPDFGGIDGEDLGLTVAIEGDYIVVGAPHIIAGAWGGGYGRAFIFRRDDRGTPDDPLDDAWWEDAELRTPDEIRWGDMFGYSVAISEGTVLVGRPGSLSWLEGSAYVYRRVNGVWRHTASLNPSDSTPDDRFGNSVSLSGMVALVGAPYRSDGGTRSGAAYVFRENTGLWMEEARLVPNSEPPFGLFGCAVGVSGEQAVVGAHADDDAGDGAGSSYIFVRDKAAWSGGTKLLGSDTSDLDSFGQAVSTGGGSAVVGAPGENSHRGAAYLFQRKGEQWVEKQKLVASDRPTNTLGVSVAVDERYAFAGAREAVYVYVIPSAATSLREFASFQACFRGEERGFFTECARFDLVADGRIDLRDFNELMATLAGP